VAGAALSPPASDKKEKLRKRIKQKERKEGENFRKRRESISTRFHVDRTHEKSAVHVSSNLEKADSRHSLEDTGSQSLLNLHL
jgi:hypothetical protein